jgi:putative oxidoreductase
MDISVGTVHTLRAPASGRAAALAVSVARILLGCIFFAAGLSGFVFLFLAAPPAPAGLAGAFQDVFFRSHWVQFVDGVELIAGVLLLANRYVALALTLLGAVIANILVFHITMQPETILAPIVILGLWLAIAYRHRARFAPLFSK